MWLFWAVVIFLIICAVQGYRRGFIKEAYGLAAIILSILLVTVVTPYVKDIMMEKTDLYEKIADKCTIKVQEKYEKEAKENGKPTSTDEALEMAGIKLPHSAKDSIVKLSEVENWKNDVYRKAGEEIATWVVYVIAFIGTLILVGLLVGLVGGMLDIFTKLPLVKGINQFLGIFGGIIKGVLILWIVSIVITIFCTSEFATDIMHQIYQNKYLCFLYENNGILYLLAYFMA